MKNFTQVNRALAAEKNFYLIEMLRGCSKRSGTTFRQSNPDGQPTVNRQSRLMSHRGNLKNLAMLFAVLVMSIGNVWGANYYILSGKINVPLTRGMSSSSYQVVKSDGSTLSTTTDISGSITDKTASVYYNGTSVAYADLSNLSNYSTSSGENRTIQAIKIAGSATLTITLSSKTFSKMDVIYRCESDNSKSLKIDGTNYNTSDKNIHKASIEKSFSTSISIANESDKNYDVIVILTESAAPSGKNIYLKPNGIWNTADPAARFAAYYFKSAGDGTGWVDFASYNACTPCFKATIPSGYDKVILCRMDGSKAANNWDNRWNQTLDLTVPTGNDTCFTISSIDGCTNGKSCGSWGTYTAPTYTISFAGNDNTGGSMSSISSIACEADQAVTANAYTKTGYSFTGWKADVDVKVGGSTKTAGTLLADGVTIQDISSNITLTAQWEAAKYTVTYNVNGGGSVTPTSATQASSGASVTLPTPTWSGYTFDGWYNAGTKIGNGGASYTPTADITLYAHWTDNISGKVFSFIDNNYGDKFKSFTGYGWVAKDSTGRSKTFTNASTGVEYRVSAAGWDEKNNAISALAKFLGGTSSMSIVIPTGKIATVKISYNAYGTGDDYRLTVNSTAQANPSTKLADGNTNAQVISNMKEITLNNQTGTLTLGISNTGKNNYIGRVSAVITGYTVSYAAGTYGSGSLDSGTKTAGSSFTLSSSSSAFTRSGYVYDGWSINEDGSTKDYNLGGSYTTDAPITLYPHWVAACTTPAAPTNFTAGSISATGATFTITDAADAASYDIYYSTSSTEPIASTEATTTSTSKTKAVTGLTAATTYYAWVRSVCDASHKSAWVALNPDDDTHTFATSCVAPSTVTVAPTNANGYRYTPGETISLTCTASGGSGGDYSYQWQKYNGSAWEDIDGATSAVYSKANCTTSDGGSYRCKVSTGEDCTTISDGGDGYKIRVWTFNGNYNDEGFIANNITWTGANTGTVTLTLNANSTYKFKVYDNDGKYFGCNSGITADVSNWTFRTNESNCSLTTGKVAGEYTFTIDITNVGDNNISVSVVYPKMRIYMVCGGTWCDADPAFFVHSWKSSTTNDAKMIAHPCEDGVYYADLPSFVTDMTILRLKTGTESVVWEGNANFLNRSSNITIGSNDKFTFSSWNTGVSPSQGTFTAGTYSPTTYTVSAAASTAGYGTVSAASVTGVACGTSISASSNTLTVGETNVTAAAASATAEYTYAFDNWTWTPAGATVTSDVTATANFTRTPKSYTLTWNLAGGKVTVAGTGAAVNATGTPSSSVAFGTDITAPTVTKTGYTFSAWSSTPAATMPAANTTYTAQWTVKTTTITIDANSGNHGSTAPSSITATYGSELPSFTAATGASGYSLTGYFTEATSGTKVINADGSLVANTDYADGSGNWKYETATLTLYPQYVAAAGLTAISADVLYQAASMANITFTGDDQNFTGLSTNNLFKVYGTDGNAAKGKNENHDVTDDISKKSFTSALYILSNSNTTSTDDPTQGAIEIITPSTAGLLYLYLDANNSSLTLKKQGTKTSTSLSGATYKAMEVDANTHYFINGSSSGKRGLYGIQYVSTYSVSITPTSVTKATGATGAGAAIKGKAYTATFTANTGYTLPSDVTVTIGGASCTKGTEYTWTVSSGTGTLTVKAANVTGNIVVTVTGTAAATYALNYECNGAESGCPSNTTASALPNPLPTGLTKDGYTFGGWFTDEELTVSAVAGAAMTEATTLYAKWTVNSSSECITIAYFDASQGSSSSNKPDKAGKYLYGYTNSAKTSEYAYTLTTGNTNNKGQGTGDSDYLRMDYGTTVTVYADNTTTGGTPASFENVTGVSVDFKMKNSSYYTSFDIYVGDTKIADNVSLSGAAQTAFTTFAYEGLAQLSGTVRIVNKGSGSSNYHFYVDNIEICTASMSSCTTPTLPTLADQGLCEGADIAAWNATVTNAAAIEAAGETVTYSWKKKGNATELANTASFDLGASAAESQAGTYVVTVTVSKAGYASASASKEVDLSVTEGTEAPTVTQSTTPVYEGNSVTLTATATTGATYTWHTCNADGTGESSAISGATTNAYTIASAPAAGTHYYKVKVTGDGTHTCGNAETVYALTVSEAAGGDCFHFVSVIPESNINISSGASIVTPTHATTLEGGTMKVGSQQVVITAGYGLKMEGTKTVSITLDAALEAGNVVIVKGTSGTKGYGITINGVDFYDADNKTFDVSYTVLADDGLEGQTALTVSKYSGSSYLQEIKITGCGTACTDPEVTASADNTTACAGTSVTFTATGAHASATYQWQKLDGTWTNISGATASTYNIPSVVAGDAGKYRVIATHDCSRTSNEVTLSVPSTPNFGSTVPASVSVMRTIALSINTVEATDAVKYKWYKSADATWDAGDTEIGTNKELIKAYDGEAIGSPSYYIFCRAQNACGITTSTAIEVNVTAYVEEDCATRGNEGDAEFGFEYSAGQATYSSTACWSMNDNSKKLIYTAPEGKYFKTMKVTIASSSASKASYNWSTNGGTTFTEVAISSINTTLTEKTIDVSAHGNVNALQIGRNLGGNGESSGTLYVSKICFEYTDACTATTVTPSESSVNYEMDGSSFTEPTFTVKHGGTAFDPQPTLTYSSSNEDIASVDDDGTVTFNGDAGTVTITASYAGGTISATEYCASQGSYTITVSCSGGAPKVVAAGSTDMENCNSSVTLHAKKQDGTAFADGTYQWFRNGEEIDGETSSSYTATQAGTYTVERTNGTGCTTPSTNSAVVTSETTEPEVERLVPFQYYHVDKTYSDQMKMRHLFAVKNSGTLDGKHFKMYVSRNGGVATDVTSSNALVVWPNADGHVDTVMVDLNKLNGKYSENDELVFTCKAVDCESNVSDVYKNTITMNVIGATPTLALICSGSSKAGGTRKTSELTVGGDFLTGYNVADLCQQTGNTSFDANTEWGLYTDLKANYIVTPVNGYAVFNKLNYEPFDILLLTDYPKASKSDAAKNVLDDMAALCDYRPMLSFKTHMVAKSPSKWAAKGFTTSATENKADGRLNLNIVCYAHPMFEHLKDGANVYRDADNSSELVYTMLSGTGYEGSKGMQGFEIDAAENFVTIGLTHYNASAASNTPSTGNLRWTPNSGDRMLVTVAERQTNIEARFILFSINCGAQSKLTDKGEEVILACLEYLLDDDPLHVADCSFTFDNGANAPHDAEWYKDPENCPGCSGELGDGLWSTEANWGPDRINIPGEYTSARIAAPVTVDIEHAKAMELRIINEGSIDIPAGKALDVKSTIRRMEDSEIYPTEENDIHIGSASTGNGTLIFNNNSGDTKARVDMYSNALADVANMSAATSTWQYIGTPHNDVASATRNYYDSWLYQYSGSGWEVIPNGGPLVPFRGYCVTHPHAPVVFDMEGTLVATTAQDIAIPAGYTVIANSWTAPIDINAITDDDMENISDKTIYFFNTGSDADGNHGTGTAAGTYRATPIHSASYTGDWQIPSMQGFYISTTSAGTLHLDYERHVRPTGSRSVVSNPMYAPRRAAAESDEPNVLKIFARGSRYQDKLIVLEREDFTRGYDSGWDGEAWGGSNLSPMVYVTGEGREDAVSAIPEFEGTVVAFKAGEDSEYRFEFIYDSDEPLYLFDTENNTYTQIMTGNAYYFTTTDKAAHSRFILTRKAPQIATGVGEVPSDQVLSTKAKKLLIEDKMYILLNGMLYDATGKVVFK